VSASPGVGDSGRWPSAQPSVLGMAAHRCGALVTRFRRSPDLVSTVSRALWFGVAWNTGCRGWLGRTRCWVLRKRTLQPLSLQLCAVGDGAGLFLLGCGAGSLPSLCGGVGVWWFRLFFENCTVDASISEQDATLYYGGWVLFSVAIC
jgi:hypothetical protein